MSIKSAPLVSVVMPVYNGEKYLKTALDSILAQTFVDFELIIVNDGSNDGTPEILKNYSDPRVTIINNAFNIGIPKSLNKALKIIRGEYFCRQDADDFSLPERLERQVAFLKKHDSMGAVGSSYSLIDLDSRDIKTITLSENPYTVHFMCMPSILIRKACLEKVGLFREVFDIAEDYDFYLRLSEYFKIGIIVEPLYKYRIYNSSTTGSRKLITDLFASLALDMAEERRRYGKDRLSTAMPEEADEIRRKKQNLKGLILHVALSKLRTTWADAAFQLGERRKAYGYAKEAIMLYPLNLGAVQIFLKTFPCILKLKFHKIIS
jgi:glycosyltransferase involved in cell wall biosynthesis